MKTVIKMYSTLILVFFLLASCSGDDGDAGPQGVPGEIGPAGEDGNTILGGSGAPTSKIGVQGDFYLNKDTAELYGPKIDNETWGSPIALAGSNGVDGSQILSGDVTPDNMLGLDGDFYLNKSTFDLYGPKSAGAWGTPVNLKGTTDVRYTGWFNFNDTATRTDFFFLQTLGYGFLADEYIDNGGSILVYMGWVSGAGLGSTPIRPDEIYQLPKFGSSGVNEWETTFRLNTSPTSGWVHLIIDVENTTAVTREEFLENIFYVNNRFFRVIFIPGGTALKNAKGIDYSNYEEVKRYYGIKE